MEDATRGRSGHGGEVKEKIGAAAAGGGDESFRISEVVEGNQDQKSSSPEHKDSSLTKQLVGGATCSSTMDPDSKAPSSSQKEQDDQHESAKAEMGQVIEENQRLKLYLDRMMKDYKSLQMQFYHAIHQEEIAKASSAKTLANSHQAVDEESELISLSLGRFSGEPKKIDHKAKTSSHDQDDHAKQGLSLRLDCKFEAHNSHDCADQEALPNPLSPVNGLEEAGEACLRSKALKTMRNGGDDEVPQQNPAKKVRISVRAKCDTPTMNDGCQWRKYGQKISKGNPCPRAYYRCTISPSCPVRKQVQRCADDMSILITTYEGTHNHPLPMSATAMASTTSAAASMLLSGSSSSSSRPGPAISSTTITNAADLHGLSFYPSSSDNSKPKQYFVHNSSVISSLTSYPTITLDLTSAPSSSSSSSHPLNRFSSTYSPLPKFASTSLTFGSSSEPNTMPWGNGILNHGSSTSSANTSTPQPHTINYQHGRPPIDNKICHSYIHKNVNIQADPSQQYPVLPDTIAAATKAITDDPNFQCALVAALTSMISPGNLDNQRANWVGGDNYAQKLKWGDNFPAVSGSNNNDSATTKENGYATSYLNKTTSSTNSQPGGLMFLPPSLSFSSAGSASTSLGENRDHID